MRAFNRLLLVFVLAAAAPACGGDDDPSDPNDPNDPNDPDDPDDPDDPEPIEVSADISADDTWTADNVYVLTTNVFVRNATLTIEPGTTIRGESNSSLVITSTARLEAVGTASDPIVFTSAQPAGSRGPGDWGGVVLLGSARINVAGGTDSIEGFPAGTEGTEFGGSDDAHDCGSLQYVRIEFAGFELSTDNELNGLTLGACGSGTQLDFIQVHRGADDGIEFFGGTAGLTHALVTQPDDDGIDWDFGWSGNAQFLIVQQNAVVGNNGFEADNNGNNNDATPRSAPTIYNVTLVGSNAEPGAAGKQQVGMLLRRGTAGIVRNAIIAHFTDVAIDVADFSTVQQATGGALTVESSVFFDNANDDADGWPTNFDVVDGTENDCQTPGPGCTGFDERDHFTDAARDNDVASPMLLDPLDLAAPVFVPMAGSPMLTDGVTPPAGFDTSATFIGAVGATDWTTGWTAYPAN